MKENRKIIYVKNLTKKFADFKAVNNITFSVLKGEIFAFLGPNGAGKSTTIKMLTTLLLPDSGEIRLNGFDAVINQNEARKSFGIVFQDPSVDGELTAYENMFFHSLLYGLKKKEAKEKIKKLLSMVKLWDKRDNLVKTYSGGMKRRLEIARGFLHHPKILFLDEPTLGLDPQTRNHIWNYIKKLNKEEQLSVFFTSHYMDEVEKMADRLAIIDQGRIIAQGKVEEIKSQNNVKTLEEAFLNLTGRDLREESADSLLNIYKIRR